MATAIQLFDKKNNPITGLLIEINDKRLICNCDSIDLLPMGSIIDCNNYDIEWQIPTENNFIVNKSDLINIRFSHSSGCCGPDGDVMNVRDNCNKCIGFEFGDCWMSHCILIPKNKVIAQYKQHKKIYTIFAMTEYKKKQKIIDRALGFDYNTVKQRLDLQIKKRLKFEINNSKIEKELKEKSTYYELKDIASELGKYDEIDDFWLFTKYDEKKR